MERKTGWKEWRPITVYALFSILIPAAICRALYGSWSIETDFEGLLAGALSIAGLGVATWINKRW